MRSWRSASRSGRTSSRASPLSKPKILVVEDEEAIADTIRYVLSTDGLEPVWCDTGAKALAVATKDPIALAVLDVGLPDINGFELFRQLQVIRPIPVIFLTARSDEIDRVSGLELGADDYVAKPFSPRELSARVRGVLRRAQSAWSVASGAAPNSPTARTATTSQNSKALVLDEERRRILYYGTPLDLSRYEYGLLKTLMSRPGRVFSREDLLAMVWNEPEERYDRTVDTHVKTVRAKLAAIAPAREAIVTHRGIGYALAEDLPDTAA